MRRLMKQDAARRVAKFIRAATGKAGTSEARDQAEVTSARASGLSLVREVATPQCVLLEMGEEGFGCAKQGALGRA